VAISSLCLLLLLYSLSETRRTKPIMQKMPSQWGNVQLKRSLLLLLASSLFSLLLADEVTIVAEKSIDSEPKQVSALRGSPPTKKESYGSAQWELLPGKNVKKNSPLQVSDLVTRKLLKRERKPKDLQTNSSSVISAEQTDTNLTGKLKVIISTLTNTFSATDPVAINFTIVNEGENTARILKWFIPKNSVTADVLGPMLELIISEQVQLMAIIKF